MTTSDSKRWVVKEGEFFVLLTDGVNDYYVPRAVHRQGLPWWAGPVCFAVLVALFILTL